MNQFVAYYNNHISLFAAIILGAIFIFIQFNSLKKINNFSIEVVVGLIKIWIPFLASISVIFFFFYFSKPLSQILISYIENNLKNPRNAVSAIYTKWDFIVCSFANIILIGLSTLTYSSDIGRISILVDKRANKALSTANILINLTILINVLQFVGLTHLTLNGDITGGNLLLILNDVFSLVNMIFYLAIDDRIIVAGQKYSNDANYQKIVQTFSKPARFAKYNVDFACVIGILFTLVFQNFFLKYNDTNYAFAFTTGCITTQLFLTQFIFALYQSFRLSKN